MIEGAHTVAHPLLRKLVECDKKFIVCQGGGDAGKTVTILQYLCMMACSSKCVITVTGQDGPNLTGGALRGFQKYVYPDKQFRPWIINFNKTEKTFYFRNGSIIEFKAFSDEQDARGSERDYLFINEANSRTYEQFWQLQRKTRRKVILDYNPTSVFWVGPKLIKGEEASFHGKVQLFITDHRHNPFLTEEEHEAYESISDPDLFRVYSRGKTGKVKGLIFGHFKEIERLPEVLPTDRVFYALDYGYSNDPTAIIKCIVRGRERYYQGLAYEPGIGAERIKAILVEAGWRVADAIYSEADPNMVNQLRMQGLPVQPAIKGPGSIAAGIGKVREFICYYVPSAEFRAEIESYKFVTAQDLMTGKEVLTNQPVDYKNHYCDSLRYGTYTDAYRNRTG